MDVSNEIQETLGRSYNVPDDIDEEDLMGGKIQINQKFDWHLCPVNITIVLHLSCVVSCNSPCV